MKCQVVEIFSEMYKITTMAAEKEDGEWNKLASNQSDNQKAFLPELISQWVFN